ncbi:hypothetical protein CkaCkLH20_00804 [Colletotrichum karsti]|uniref:Major facilitator superfamily (MFS) profile domain-containing protein n=1 Tax=Colletotrichum karsti TaxID=1095194 RepID=A0A9P6IF34_9PEZI|nr:uncharacterized protein CkaCkLH20_00804 [Colletotrichum karsti]KAF9881658.1 hypothetical protein CkaCkLH20_00804 [Colletotrichum karsti]
MVLTDLSDGGISQPAPETTTADPEKHAGKDLEGESLTASLPDTPKSNWNKPMSFYLAFASLCIMVLAVSLDATMLAEITSQLGGSTLEAFWASISFMLGVVVTQPIYTSASDVLGRKMSIYTACVLFIIGSVIFAVSKSMSIAISGRVIQGLGGGGLDVVTEIIIADITTLKERPLWIGLLSVPMALGSLAGPIIGALLSQYSDWRWIGWMNLPIIAVAVVLAFFFLNLKPMSGSLWSRIRRLDLIGMLLFAAGCTLFCLPLSWAGAMYPGSSWRTVVPLVIGIILMIAFGFWETKPSEPVFPYRIFKSRTAQVSLIGGFIHGMVMYTMLLYVPLHYQAVLFQSPLRSAISILPICTMAVVLSGLSPVVVEYTRRYRWEIWLGWVFTIIGTGLFVLWDRNSSTAELAGFQVVTGIGLGTLFTLPAIPLQASMSSVNDHGLAVGILVSFRLFGALMGLSMGSTTFSSIFSREISSLAPLPEAVVTLENASEAIAFIPFLKQMNGAIPDVLMSAIRDAYNEAMRSIWYILIAFSGIGLITSLFMKELTLETEELGRQHLQTSVDEASNH